MESYEYCFRCDQPTGRAGRGDDSLYIHDFGPFCGECFVAGEKLSEGISEITRLTAEVKRLREALAYYASDKAWTIEAVEGPNGDYGSIARAALGKGEA